MSRFSWPGKDEKFSLRDHYFQISSSKLVNQFLVDKTSYPINSPTRLPENGEVANKILKKLKKG